MWRTSGYPLKIDNVAADEIYLGWKDMLAVRNNRVISLRTGENVSHDYVLEFCYRNMYASSLSIKADIFPCR